MTITELKNRLTLPVIVSPMFLVSGSKLAIESCKNGIVGTIPSLNGRTSEAFEQLLIEITSTLKQFEEETGIKPAPFGVNLIVNKTNPRLMPDLELCVKYQVPIIITSLGAVKEVVDAVHSYGGLVFHDVIKKRHAEKAIESGVDGIIAVANGAGGHGGTANPFALVEEIRSFYDGTLILAGTITKGKDILAAENMGADFAYMGTRFIATEESLAQSDYKKMLVASHIEDIIYTDGISGVNANFLLPSIEKSGVDLTEKKEEDFSKLSDEHSKAWKDIWSAGQGTTGIEKVESVANLVNELKREYKETLFGESAEAGGFEIQLRTYQSMFLRPNNSHLRLLRIKKLTFFSYLWFMSAAENKLNLVQMIVESEDKTFVSKVLEYARSLKKEKKTDWAEELPEHVLEELRLAIEEADNGTDVGIPHEVMLKKFRKQYPHLNL